MVVTCAFYQLFDRLAYLSLNSSTCKRLGSKFWFLGHLITEDVKWLTAEIRLSRRIGLGGLCIKWLRGLQIHRQSSDLGRVVAC
ncbi:hypothetical protein BVC80_8607g3 [Macleaya cordata]|uniref:Uncharacterized protein n=1 Tax=Macleaya cordata TaxID=56857 RepID=A0A200PYN2_MACCD|nr:hypothetical protein BVC80_8607g3 [Macleaya cordata]